MGMGALTKEESPAVGSGTLDQRGDGDVAIEIAPPPETLDTKASSNFDADSSASKELAHVTTAVAVNFQKY